MTRVKEPAGFTKGPQVWYPTNFSADSLPWDRPPHLTVEQYGAIYERAATLTETPIRVLKHPMPADGVGHYDPAKLPPGYWCLQYDGPRRDLSHFWDVARELEEEARAALAKVSP